MHRDKMHNKNQLKWFFLKTKLKENSLAYKNDSVISQSMGKYVRV